MECSNEHHRHILIFYFPKRKKAAQAHKKYAKFMAFVVKKSVRVRTGSKNYIEKRSEKPVLSEVIIVIP